MKTLKAICTAAILSLTLSIPAYGGDIETPGIKAHNSGTTTATAQSKGVTTSSTIVGDIETPGLVFDALWILVAMF